MDEYIKREALKEVVANLRWSNHLNKEATLNLMDRAIDNLPAADVVERKRGEWIGEADGYADGELVYDVWYCSECNHCIDDGTDDPTMLPNFCPNCGADMRGEKNEAD